MSFSFENRERFMIEMAAQPFDLAVIGGGITGAGIARDAASRGMKVALIEARDFASGTSSRSSKLIHGGIRYLENMEFHLVFEALSERQRLFEIAPHLVHPLRFLIPVYRGGRVPAWKLGMGMWAYDALSLFEAPELNQHLSPREVAHEFPSLRRRDLEGAFAYYDAYMDDDRLVLETLRSAINFGAKAINYVEAQGVEVGSGQVTGVECRDAVKGREFTIRARHVISSVGPWTDRLGGHFFPNWKRALRPSKGVHLTFNKSRFQLQDAVVMAAESRIVFAIPRHEMVIVGTTDTDYPGDPLQVRTEKDDVRYLLDVIAKYFPGSGIGEKDIVACYAGVRPLIDDGAQTESKTSREHAIWTNSYGVTFVAGGKYTTYRNMAAQTVDHALAGFSLEERVRFAKSQTLSALNPLVTEDLLERARTLSDKWAEIYRLPAAITRELAERHGLEAEDIIRAALPKWDASGSAEQWMWVAEALHAVENTMCLSLADFYLRRTHLILAREDHGIPFAKSIAQAMGERLGWSPAAQNDQINALQNQMKSDLSAILSS